MVEATDEFSEIREVIARYETLVHTHLVTYAHRLTYCVLFYFS